MALIKADLITAARRNLMDPSGTVWPATPSDTVGAFLADVILDVTKREALLKYANLAIVDYTRDVDLSPLTMAEIFGINWPAGGPARNYKLLGSRLILDLVDAPVITKGTLTGTLTFTKDSRNVTGVGTLFLTELTYGVNGYLIANGTKYYQVAYVTSNVALVLAEPFEETTVPSATSVKYRDYQSCVRINYGGPYTIDTTTDAPGYMDDVFIAGLEAYAMKSWVANYAQLKMVDITSKLASAATQIGLGTAQIAQAITDIGTFRTNLTTDVSDFTNGLAAIATAIGLASTDLVSARVKIPTINEGGDEGTKLINSAATEIQKAKELIETVTLQSEQSKMSKQYLDIADELLKTAKEYMDQANQYTILVQQSVSSNYFVMSYGNFAKEKWEQYQYLLGGLGRVEDGFYPLTSREM